MASVPVRAIYGIDTPSETMGSKPAIDSTSPRTTVTIDGLPGAGKSTLAHLIARHFGLRVIEMGIYFNALGIWEHLSGKLGADAAASMPLSFCEEGGVYLDGLDVSRIISTPEVAVMASELRRDRNVTHIILEMQQRDAAQGDVVVVGRGAGAMVCPYADLKVALTATFIERVKRRWVQCGGSATFEEVEDVMRERDTKEGILLEPESSLIIDTSGLTLGQVFQIVSEGIYDLS